MAKPSAERRRLLLQATHGFAQRHPDYTVAGIDREIAEAVGLSVASVQRWRAGHHIPKWHIPALAEWAVRRAGMDRLWLRAFLRHCGFGDDPDLEARLCGPESILPIAAWRIACQSVNTRFWGNERLTSAMALHQPRAALLDAIRAFLASDRAGLILVDASGLGKTSLALWLATWPDAPQPVLVYPAARLDGTQPLADLLRGTLGPSLDPPTGGSLASPLTRPILVIFDGVNESPEMLRLVWQLDRGLVEAAGLKVMLTFRPESFQIARHNVALAEHRYFFELPAGLPAVSVAADPPAIQLLPFTLEELPAAYDLYRRAYALKTPYATLSDSLHQALRHPLTLRLLAQTHAGGDLPAEVETETLVQRLLDVFVATGRLQRADIRFLEDELMALMIAPGHWSNAITEDQMVTARADDGRRLIAPNEPGPLTRLADAGLLATTNGRLDEPLRFAHERLYEHFSARRLRFLRTAATDTLAFYADLVTAPVFLHAPARRLLADEMASRPISWLVDLARGAQVSRWGILVGALQDWERSSPGRARAALDYLWRLGQSRGARWLNALGLPAPEPRAPAWQLQRLAVSAAGALGDRDLLLRALLGGSQAMQQVVVDEVLHWWSADVDFDRRLLEELGQRVTGRWGEPHLAATLAFFQLATSVRFQQDQSAESRVFLQQQMRSAARRLFRPPWRGLLLGMVVDRLVRSADQSIVNSGLDRSFDTVFHLPAERLRHLEALAPFIDWTVPGFEAAAGHVLGALEAGALIASWFAIIPLVTRGLQRRPEARAMILALLREGAEAEPPRPWLDTVCGITRDIIRHHRDLDPELWALLDTSVSRIVASYPVWHEHYRSSQFEPPRQRLGAAHGAGPYMVAREVAGLPIETGPVWDVIVAKAAARDVQFALDYLQEVRFVAWDLVQPRLALRLVRPLLGYTEATVQHAFAALLARIRAVAAEDVRELLESGAAPPEVVAMVQSWPVEEPSGERWYFGMWDLVYRLVLESETARRLGVQIFGSVPRFRDARAWLAWTAKLILNELAEEEVFEV